jgi:hypothetical protein
MNSNYLLIQKSGSDNSKRLQRRFRKHRINKAFVYTEYKNDFETQSLELLRDFLISIKQKQRQFTYKNPQYLGVLTDDNILLMRDFFSVPKLPDSWDILFLEYTLNNIDDKKSENVVWKNVNISDSRHLLINPYSIDKILEIIKKSDSWKTFIEKTNGIKSFGITNLFYSERILYVSPESIYNNNFTQLDYKSLVNTFSKYRERVNSSRLYEIYPNISFVCCLTDQNKFLHALYTFLSVDYPTDKIELVVVDDTDSERSLKKFLPEDSRIRFINIKPKSEQDKFDVKNDNKKTGENVFPLGYKLNVALKYCRYDTIFHLFDTNIYIKQNIKHLIECYLLSKGECIVSYDSGIYDKETESSNSVNISDLGNMIYSKRFWTNFNFTNNLNDTNKIAYNFTKFRQVCVKSIPFVYWSYNIRKSNHSEKYINKLNFDLHILLNERDKQSANMIFL